MVSVGVLWLKNGVMPATQSMSGMAKERIDPPLMLSRLFDPMVMVVPTVLLVLTAFNLDAIYLRVTGTKRRRYIKLSGSKPRREDDFAFGSYVTGLVVGLIGGISTPFWGIYYLVVATAVVAVVCLFATVCTPDHLKSEWGFAIPLAGVTAFWLASTYFGGAVPSVVYSVIALAVSTVVYFGLLYGCRFLRWLVRSTTQVGTSWLLTCPVEDRPSGC